MEKTQKGKNALTMKVFIVVSAKKRLYSKNSEIDIGEYILSLSFDQ